MSVPYYDADGITLYLGDCREELAWLEADVLVTDPPYGIVWKANGLDSKRQARKAAKQSIVNDGDTMVRDEALRLWGKAKPAVVFGSWRNPRPSNTTHRLIWHKRGRHPGVSPAAYFPNDEEIYLLGAGWVGSPSPSVITTLEQRASQPERVGHPTPKPVHLMEHLILKSASGVIADPFAGSGATLLAARNQRRQAIGIEVEEQYCELIALRLAQADLFV